MTAVCKTKMVVPTRYVLLYVFFPGLDDARVDESIRFIRREINKKCRSVYQVTERERSNIVLSGDVVGADINSRSPPFPGPSLLLRKDAVKEENRSSILHTRETLSPFIANCE